MNEPAWENATEREVWEYVAVQLKKRGVDTVLVGGAVVAIYSDGLYRSGDLDLVRDSMALQTVAEEALDQAVRVARRQKYDAAEIKRWCRAAGKNALAALKEMQLLLKQK